MPRFMPAWGRLLTAALCCLAGWPAQADYPDRPVTLVVANAVGGASDSLARGLAAELTRQLGQPVVVENVGGASGALGAQKVLRAAPDGYTLLLGTTSDLVVTPLVSRNANYSVHDFTPIAKLGVTPLALVARNTLGIATAEQLAQLARHQPHGLLVGTTGQASLPALASLALQRSAGIAWQSVPYQSSGPLLADVLSGRLDLGVVALPAAWAPLRAGRLTMLGLLSDVRSAAYPDLPALGESAAFKGVSMALWAGLMGPAKLPSAVTERLGQALQTLLNDPDFTQRRARQGDTAVPYQPVAEFAAFLSTEAARYRALTSGL